MGVISSVEYLVQIHTSIHDLVSHSLTLPATTVLLGIPAFQSTLAKVFDMERLDVFENLISCTLLQKGLFGTAVGTCFF